MSASDTIRYLEPTPKAGWLFMQRGFEGSVVMLNLLRFREMAAFEQIINAQHADQPSWCRSLIGKYPSLAPFAPEPVAPVTKRHRLPQSDT